MSKTNKIAALGIVLEAARAAGEYARAQRVRRALRSLGAVA